MMSNRPAHKKSDTPATSAGLAFASSSSSLETHSIAAWRSTTPEGSVTGPDTDAGALSAPQRASSDAGASSSVNLGSFALRDHVAATVSKSADSPDAPHGIDQPRSWR